MRVLRKVRRAAVQFADGAQGHVLCWQLAVRRVTFFLQMFSWAEQAQPQINAKSLHKKGRLSRQQLALAVALFDEAESMYLTSGRSMRHVLLDADFNSKSIRVALLRECVQVSVASCCLGDCVFVALQLCNNHLKVNALTPNLDATSLEICEVLVRGSGQLLRSNGSDTPEKRQCQGNKTAGSEADILEIDDDDDSAAVGAVDAGLSDKLVAAQVVQVQSDSDGIAEPAFGRALSSQRLARVAAPIKRYMPVEFTKQGSKKRSITWHDNECFLCNDGGELLECDVCPHVYHLDCVGLSALPKGLWRCPWHSCSECDKSSSRAEGVLFHCMTCPLTYCFECAPDEYTIANHQWTACAAQLVASLQGRGMDCSRSYRFFQCKECVDDERVLMNPRPKPAPKPPKAVSAHALPPTAKGLNISAVKQVSRPLHRSSTNSHVFTIFPSPSALDGAVRRVGQAGCEAAGANQVLPTAESAVASLPPAVIGKAGRLSPCQPSV